MNRKALAAAWLLATVACVDSPIVEDGAHDDVRMETDEVSVSAEWSVIRFKWGLPYLLQGEMRYVDAYLIDSRGRENDELPIEFSSEDPELVRVAPNGAVTGLKPGRVDLVARYGELETRLEIDVESAEPATIQLSTGFIVMNWLEEASVFATAYNEQGRMLDVPIAWRSLDGSVAVVEDGDIEAIGRGTAQIEAVAGGARAVVRVTVVSPPPFEIEVVDTPIYLDLGAEGRINALVLAADGQVIEDASVAFESVNPGILWVERDTGRTKGLAEGAAKIAITSGDARANFQMFVREPAAN